jgi:tetratricopeptide (TPR) repeat protein
MNPDRLAELEEQRGFLLRSLTDLEREHAAGDVDDVDYRALRDGYTVRAAATLREIEDGRRGLPDKPPADWRRRLFTLAGAVVAIAIVSWVLIASSAERKPGQEQTGLDPRDQREVLMAQARVMLQRESPGQAAAIYAQVLELDADYVDAIAYRGWALALDAVQSSATLSEEQIQVRFAEALDLLNTAVETDPSYPDPKCFLGVVYLHLKQPDVAAPWVDECLAANPPADVRGLVEAMAADADR